MLDSGKWTAIVSSKLAIAQWVIETQSIQLTLNTTFSYELWSKQSQPLFITELVKSNFLLLGEKFTNWWQIGNFPWWRWIVKWDYYFLQNYFSVFFERKKENENVHQWLKEKKLNFLQNVIQRVYVWLKKREEESIFYTFFFLANRFINLHDFLLDLVDCWAFWSNSTWDEGTERFWVSV